jgi:hypothetical protein
MGQRVCGDQPAGPSSAPTLHSAPQQTPLPELVTWWWGCGCCCCCRVPFTCLYWRSLGCRLMQASAFQLPQMDMIQLLVCSIQGCA